MDKTAEHTNQIAMLDDIIKTIATSPQASMDVLKLMIEQRAEAQESAAKSAFNAAMPAMQNAIPEIPEMGQVKDARGNVKSTYATWEDINEITKPILFEHGFSLSFEIDQTTDFITTIGHLTHQGGDRLSATIALPADITGDKNAVQSIGSAISYGKRYAANALLNLATRSVDDDGAAAGRSTISNDEIMALMAKIKEAGTNEADFAAYLNIASMGDLTADKLEHANMALDHKIKNKPAKGKKK